MQLVYCQWASITVVHIQDKELQRDAGLVEPQNQNSSYRRKEIGEYLKIVNHGDVTGRDFPNSIVYNRISLWTRDAAGGEDLVVLVHTEGLPTQVLHRQGLTVKQHLISSYAPP